MASYNRIILVGNLTRDPQLSYTASNTAVCKFGIATNHKWRDRDGNTREEVCFVDCTLFGKGGETFNQYMRKGQPVLVEGRLHYNQWTTQEGEKRAKHEVVVDNFQFLGGGQGGQGGARRGPAEVEAPVPAGARMGTNEYDAGPPPADDDPPF